MSVPATEMQKRNPLFYSDPQPLGSDRFGSWRMKGGNAAFTANVNTQASRPDTMASMKVSF